MMRMLPWPLANFLMLNAERSVICGGADHVVGCTDSVVDVLLASEGDGMGGGTMVIVWVTVCGEPVIVTVEAGRDTVEVTVIVDVVGAGGDEATAA